MGQCIEVRNEAMQTSSSAKIDRAAKVKAKQEEDVVRDVYLIF